MKRRMSLATTAAALLPALPATPATARVPALRVSDNTRYLQAGGAPFFRLGERARPLLSHFDRTLVLDEAAVARR